MLIESDEKENFTREHINVNLNIHWRISCHLLPIYKTLFPQYHPHQEHIQGDCLTKHVQMRSQSHVVHYLVLN